MNQRSANTMLRLVGINIATAFSPFSRIVIIAPHFALNLAPFFSHSLFFTPVQQLQMDWEGQKLAEQLMQIMLLAFAVIAFGAGYLLASFQTMILTYAGGVALTTLVTLPNWPFFNNHPLKWLDPSEAEKHPKPQPSVNVTAKKKSIKK